MKLKPRDIKKYNKLANKKPVMVRVGSKWYTWYEGDPKHGVFLTTSSGRDVEFDFDQIDDIQENSVNERSSASTIRKKLLKKFGKDPLYREFILAKTPKEQKKAVDTLKSIRGPNAIRLMQKYTLSLQRESINEAMKRVDIAKLSVGNTYKDSKGYPVKIIDINGGGNSWKITYKDSYGKTKTIKTSLSKGVNLYESINESNKLLKQSKLSSTEYQRAKKLSGFKAANYKWDSKQDLYIKEGKINESYRQGDKFELGKDLDYGDEKLHAGDYEVVRSKGPRQYQLKDTHSGKQYTVYKKDFEKYTKKKQFKQINEAGIFSDYHELNRAHMDNFIKNYKKLNRKNVVKKKDDNVYGFRKGEREAHWKFDDNFKLHFDIEKVKALGLINSFNRVKLNHPWG
tara:strand:+ start:6480 stop:7676 length:1197 start_codon:yes stop_codon:yes gene_type:complete